jgi:membrane fusion protein (multidrug efflux system)
MTAGVTEHPGAEHGAGHDDERRDAGDHRPQRPASPRAKHLTTLVGVLLVLGAAAVVVLVVWHKHHAAGAERSKLEQERDKGERVTVARVESTPGVRTITLPGDVRGFNQTTLYAKVSGYVSEMRVERGQRVRHGQILARILSPENQRDVAQARQDFELAQVNAQRYQRLAPSGVVSAQDRDNAVTQAQVSRSALSRAQDVLDYTVVRAPFDGIVSARYVDPGALVPAATSGTQSALPIVDVADVSVVRVFVYVGQDAAAFVHVGDDVVVWQDELPDRRIPAKVTYFTGVLDPRTRAMQVEVDIPNEKWNLLPGTFADVELKIAEPPAPLLPDDAIVVRQGKTQVVIVEGGKAHYVDVDLGYNDGAKVRVLRGLKGGETVGTSVPVEVEDGAPIQVVPPKNDADGGSPSAGAPGGGDAGK